jgi:hypothetical protein
MNELTEYPMFGTGALILMFSINLTMSVLFGVGLAYLCKILWKNFPSVIPFIRLIPWRSMTALAMFAFAPSIIACIGVISDGMGFFIREVLPLRSVGLEPFVLICFLYQISFLVTVWAAAALVNLWIQSSPLSRMISSLRSFVVVGIYLMLNAQLFSGTSGLGGAFYNDAMMFDTEAALASFGRIVWVLLGADLFLGLIQLLVNWKAGRQKSTE